MGLLFVSLSPHCGPRGPHNPQRELGPWEPGRCFTKSRAAGPESMGHRGSHCAPGSSWMHGGSKHQATYSPAPGQIQSRGEGLVRGLQTDVYDASHIPGGMEQAL